MARNFIQVKESVLKLQLLKGDTVNLFPDYTGMAVTSAYNVLVTSIKGTGDPLVTVHTGTDRNSETLLINTANVISATKIFTEVPTSITDLYDEPEDESPEDREKRINEVADYFEKP